MIGERHQMAIDIEKEQEAQRILKEAALQREKEDEYNEYIAKEALKEATQKKKEHFYEYKTSVKKALLTEALRRIYVGSIKNPTPREKQICESLLDNYINERGVDNLLEGFREKTSLLENLRGTVMKYYQIMTEDATPDDPNSMGINRENLDDFFKEVDKTENIEDITNTIRLRVANAEEEFVTRNEEDKRNSEAILKDTSARVQDVVKSTNSYSYGADDEDNPDTDNPDDKGGGVYESARDYEIAQAKQKLYEVQNAKPRNVFDRIVRNLAEAVIVSPVLRESYAVDHGRLDMDSIVESARCMYTLLEMVSTLRMEDVDAAYVEETIRSIK